MPALIPIRIFWLSLVAAVLFVCGPTGSAAQQIRHLGTTDGLSGRQTFNIVQDKKGFMWISTRFGIDRYDGQNIRNYPMDILYPSKNPIRMTQLLLDRDSLLWAYTDNGTVYRYAEAQDRFEVAIDIQHWIRTLHFDMDNRMWIGGKFLLGVVEQGHFRQLEQPEFASLDVKRILTGADGLLLIVAADRILHFDPMTKALDSLVTPELVAQMNFRIESVFQDGSTLWLGSSHQGLFRYDLKTGDFDPFPVPQLAGRPILCLARAGQGRLLLGTDGMGLCVYDIDRRQLVGCYDQQADPAHRIAGDAVYDILVSGPADNETIWITTFSNGVNIIDEQNTSFKTLTLHAGESHLPSQQVCSLLETRDGRLWIATDSGICCYDAGTARWTDYLSGHNVITLFEDSQGHIWAGTYSSGLYELDPHGNVLSHFLQNGRNSIGTDFVYTISEDSRGRIWSGGKKGRVTIYDPRRRSFTNVGITQANYLLPQNDSTMLIASEQGVYAYRFGDARIEPCLFNEQLRSHYICDIHLESDSILWLATYGDGINRCNLRSGSVRHYTRQQGLSSDIVYALLPDGDNLWYSSEKGVGRLNMKDGGTAVFSQADGVSADRFRQLSRTRGRDGRLYFGSYDGVIHFRPEEVLERNPRGRIVFENFNLFNRKVVAGTEGSPLADHIDNVARIRLNYRQHSFSFGFGVVDFVHRNNCHFSWMLEGLETTWSNHSGEHMVNYTNIRPGHYVFRLRYVSDSQQVLDERNIVIDIIPPIWNRPWAHVLEGLSILLLGFLIYRYVRQRIEKRQSEEKIRFFINTAHDIRTPLMLINNPLYHLKEELPDHPRVRYLFDLIIGNLNKLNKMLSLLLDFQKAYEHSERLVVRQYDLNRYLEDKAAYWTGSTLSRQISLILTLPEEHVSEWFDREKMDRMLDNLVSNSIKYTHPGGSIEVSLRTTPEWWEIRIRDNGIGISKKDLKKLFRRFYRADNAVNTSELGSGLGLMLVKHYVELHKGEIRVESEENRGSCFTIRFRHGNTHLADSVCLDEDNIPIDDGPAVDSGPTDPKITVLLVEDNAELRRYMRQALGHYYHMHTAGDGLDAWERIREMMPDIVVSDAQMPRMDGFELCRNIKSTFETSHIPVILVTVADDRDNLSKGLAAGADDYIQKPFDIEYLRLKIDNIIRNRALMRHKFLGVRSDAFEDSNDLNNEFLRKAVESIERNLSNTGFSIADLSKEMGLSRTILYNKFNTITGYTPNDFIKIVRMNKAIAYFREKRYSIKEIATMVGFDEASYFSTCFKKIYGKTPRQFMSEME